MRGHIGGQKPPSASTRSAAIAGVRPAASSVATQPQAPRQHGWLPEQQLQQQRADGGGGIRTFLPQHDERQGIPSSSCGPAGPRSAAAAGDAPSSFERNRRRQRGSGEGGVPQRQRQQQQHNNTSLEQQQQQEQDQQQQQRPGTRRIHRQQQQQQDAKRRSYDVWARTTTAAIQSASCWRELAALVEAADGGGSGGSNSAGPRARQKRREPRALNHVHAAALLARAARVTQYRSLSADELGPFHGFVTAALDLAFERLPDCRPREAATVLWAAARLGLHPGALWLDAYLDHACEGGQLCRASPRDAANALWALARFGHAPAAGPAAQLLAAVVGGSGSGDGAGVGGALSLPHQHQQQPQEPCAQSLANSIWAAATLRLEVPPGWLAAWLAAAAGAMDGFTAQGIANSLWALARLNAAVPEEWLAAAYGAAARQLDRGRASPGEAAMLLHALGRLRLQPPPPAELLAAAQAAMLAGSRISGGGSSGGLATLSFADVGNALWGLAALNAPLAPGMLPAALARLEATAHAADVQSLSTALHALKRARAPLPLPDAFWRAVYAALPTALADSSSNSNGSSNSSSSGGGGAPSPPAKSLAVLALCLGKLRASQPIPEPAAAALIAALLRALRARRLNGAEIANALCGLSSVRLQGGGAAAALPELLAECDAALAAMLPRMRPREAAAAARALARLRHRPSAALRSSVEAYLQAATAAATAHVAGEPLTTLEDAQLRGALRTWAGLAAAKDTDVAAPAPAKVAAAAAAAAAAAPSAGGAPSSTAAGHATSAPGSRSPAAPVPVPCPAYAAVDVGHIAGLSLASP